MTFGSCRNNQTLDQVLRFFCYHTFQFSSSQCLGFSTGDDAVYWEEVENILCYFMRRSCIIKLSRARSVRIAKYCLLPAFTIALQCTFTWHHCDSGFLCFSTSLLHTARFYRSFASPPVSASVIHYRTNPGVNGFINSPFMGSSQSRSE